nr:hypothetical protein [Parahaliea mediterranea]
MADSVAARCDIYSAGEDHSDNSGPCRFSQRQGYITISRADGVVHRLEPVGDAPGNFRDAQGGAVYRQSGLGSAGLIFRFPHESVYVYWDAGEADQVADANNPTEPYTTADYDATTLLPCRTLDSDDMASCPAGILRMEGGQASIVVTSPGGEEFTFNFMADYVNATKGRQVDAQLYGDTWHVIVDGAEEYRVPLAAIEGG